ncbi:hypothetical protein CRE_07792 [Caenorhabditis remanei]|uniref:Uncharacterized protein n=1 Tax=Caenorhabditis remanei TaxID=31234 RepID=E3NB50_CAERE|nr:hypothetical protein CRE_07792 [Caenorhabditis remanei]
MYLILVLPFLFALSKCLEVPEFFEINIDRDHPDNIYKAFEEFKVKYNRKYKNAAENQIRMQNFVKTYNKVDSLNKRSEEKGLTSQFGINKFSDLSSQEFKRRLLSSTHGNITGFLKNSRKLTFPRRHKRQAEMSEDLPESLDLRTETVNGRYIIGDVKDQGECSTCWVFAVTAVVETILAHSLGRFKSLSEQELCDCATDGTPGCRGGSLHWGVEYILGKGLAGAWEYPEYNQQRANKSGMCEAASSKRSFPPNKLEFYDLSENPEYEMRGVLKFWKSPVAVFFQVGTSFRNYRSGVLTYEDDCRTGPEIHWHAGAVVGYGEDRDRYGRSQKYWIVKNSWGTGQWGDDGYVKVIRGRNWCDIERGAVGAKMTDSIHS